MGKSGSISLACLATSQPSILPRRLISVTSARYLLLPPFSRVTASSPEGAIATSKPPSARASSTTTWIGGSSSITRITGWSSNALLPKLSSANYATREWGIRSGPTYKNVHSGFGGRLLRFKTGHSFEQRKTRPNPTTFGVDHPRKLSQTEFLPDGGCVEK
jgi:hypothetical protein